MDWHLNVSTGWFHSPAFEVVKHPAAIVKMHTIKTMRSKFSFCSVRAVFMGSFIIRKQSRLDGHLRLDGGGLGAGGEIQR